MAGEEVQLRVTADAQQAIAEMARLTGQVASNSANMERSTSGMSSSLRGMERGFRDVARAASFFGVALSVRGLTNWISSALDVTKMTQEQRVEFESTIKTVGRLKEASDNLARSIATTLQPAMNAIAGGMDAFRKSFDPSDEEAFQMQLGRLREEIIGLEGAIARQKGAHVLPWFEDDRQKAVDDMTKRLHDFTEEYRQLLILDSQAKNQKSKLEELTGIEVPTGALLAKMPSKELSARSQVAIPATFGQPNLQRLGGPFEGMESPDKAMEAMKQADEELTQLKIDNEHKVRDEHFKSLAEQVQAEQEYAEQAAAIRQGLAGAIVGFLQAVGSEHRGAMIAAIAVEKFMAIQSLHIESLKAQGAAYAWGMITGGPVAAAAAAARTRIVYGVMEGLVAATGLVQALQVSHGGTQSTLGTSANPIVTTSGGGLTGTLAGTLGSRSQRMVELHIHGNVVGSSGIHELVEDIRDLIDNADVIVFGPNSRQAQIINGA